MFQRLADDIKDSATRVVRVSVLAIIGGLALFVTLSFLCAAAFVYVYHNYGLINACLTGAAIFLVAAIVVGICIAASGEARAPKPKSEPSRTKPTAKSSVQSILTDPVILATGLQVVRAIGLKRLIPILAIGGAALGYMASRGSDDANSADDDQPE